MQETTKSRSSLQTKRHVRPFWNLVIHPPVGVLHYALSQFCSIAPLVVDRTHKVRLDRRSRTAQGCGENDNIPIVGLRDGGYGLACVQGKFVLIQIEGAIVPLSLAIIAIGKAGDRFTRLVTLDGTINMSVKEALVPSTPRDPFYGDRKASYGRHCWR
jgi:hypothetical protein